MKFLITASFCLILFSSLPSAALSGTAVLNWNANSEADLAGYRIYYDTTSNSGNCPSGYANHVDAGKVTTYTLGSLPEGHVYYFQLTALDTSNNESACSTNPGEVQKAITYLADFNVNRAVDMYDYNTLIGDYGKTGCGNLADANKDCAVNLGDYNLLIGDYGKSF